MLTFKRPELTMQIKVLVSDFLVAVADRAKLTIYISVTFYSRFLLDLIFSTGYIFTTKLIPKIARLYSTLNLGG